MKKTVIAFAPLPESLHQRIAETCTLIALNPRHSDFDAQFRQALPYAHGLVGAGLRLGREQLDIAAQLEVIASVTVGFDNYDVDYLSARGILLTNTPDVLTETTADLAFALLMAAARRVPELDAFVKAGRWTQSIGAALFGQDVHGKKLGIVGAGRIGAAIARRGHHGFGMEILYAGNSRKPALEAEVRARFSALDELLGEADFVCVVVPLSDTTHHLIGARELGLMKSSATLINIARGAVIDEAALIAALQAGVIRAAALDVYEQEPLRESPLFQMPNVVTLPHIGSATHETRHAMAACAVENLLAALRGERPRDLVNAAAWRH
jgi:gluconate 2-dehydrogenase